MECYLRQQHLINKEKNDYKKRVLNGVAPWIALGDSHPADALTSTAWLDNLGQASDNIKSMERKLNVVISRRAGIKGVILQADPQLFSYYRLTASQSERVDDLIKDEDNLRLLILRSENRPYLVRLAWSLMQDPVKVVGSASANKVDVESKEESHEVKRKNEFEHRSVVVRVQLHTPVSNFIKHKDASTYRELVQMLISRNIKVCMVAYPVSQLYRQISAEPFTFQATRHYFQRLAEDTGAIFVDQNSALPDSAFGNPDHLLASEAPAFTNTLHHACGVGLIGSR